MEEQDKPQFFSQSSNQFYAYGYPLTPVEPARNDPITVPPQRFPERASRGQREENRKELDSICRCACIGTIFLISAIVYIAIIESINTDHPIKFRIDSFSVSHLNITNNQISGNWTIGISLRNTNRHVKILYEEFEALVFYSKADIFLCRCNLTSFIQRPKNQTFVYVKPAAWLEGLTKFVADSIAEDISLRGIVDFDVRLQVKAKYIFVMDSDQYVFDIVCKSVQLKFSPSSSAKNGTGAAVLIPDLTQTTG